MKSALARLVSMVSAPSRMVTEDAEMDGTLALGMLSRVISADAVISEMYTPEMVNGAVAYTAVMFRLLEPSALWLTTRLQEPICVVVPPPLLTVGEVHAIATPSMVHLLLRDPIEMDQLGFCTR